MNEHIMPIKNPFHEICGFDAVWKIFVFTDLNSRVAGPMLALLEFKGQGVWRAGPGALAVGFRAGMGANVQGGGASTSRSIKYKHKS